MYILLKNLIHKFAPGFILAIVSMSLAVGLAVVVFAQTSVYLPVNANGTITNVPLQPSDDPREQAIALALTQPDIALYLNSYANWRADAWSEDESSVWYLDFYDADTDDWIGHATVDIVSEQIIEYYAPRELSPEEFQAGQAKIEAYLPYDAEVAARVGNPELWGHDVTYDRWESSWKVYYWRGLDEFVVIINIDENGNVNLDQIADPYLFEEREAAELRRNQAIELAYSAPGIDQALDGIDHWRTYAQEQEGAHWTVEFIADGQQLFSVLVNIDSWQVLESGVE